MDATKGYSRGAKGPAYLGAPRGAPRGARNRSSSMVAPSDVPQLTPRRHSTVVEPTNEVSRRQRETEGDTKRHIPVYPKINNISTT